MCALTSFRKCLRVTLSQVFYRQNFDDASEKKGTVWSQFNLELGHSTHKVQLDNVAVMRSASFGCTVTFTCVGST